MLAFFLAHWFHYFYVPAGEPWYHGNVWGNLFVVLIAAPLGYLWSKTKFWPLRPLKHVLSHALHTTMLLEEVHHKLHTGENHPRVQARIDAGKHPTPKHPASQPTAQS